MPPKEGELKFNVDEAARGKPGLVGIGGVLRNSLGVVVTLFSKHVGIMESNEAQGQVILEALCLFSSSFHGKLVVESDSLNAISCVSSPSKSVEISFFIHYDFFVIVFVGCDL